MELNKKLFLAFGIWCLTLLLTVGVLRLAYGDEIKQAQAVAAYVEHFHRDMRPSYAERAKKLIPPLIEYANQYGVDPLDLACIFSLESSWRNFEGDLGEKGPGQVMPSKELAQFDLTTLDGQIEAACWRWARALEKCATLEQALTHYACGSCVSTSKRTKNKMKYRKRYCTRISKQFRKTKGS